MKKSRKKNKTKNKEPKSVNLKLLKESVLQFLNANPDESFAFKKICQLLRVKKQKAKTELGAALDQLTESNLLKQNKDGRYQIHLKRTNTTNNKLTGTVDFVNPAFAYIV